MRLSVSINTREVKHLLKGVDQCAREPFRYLLPWGNAVAKEGRETARAKGGRRFWREIAAATRVGTVAPDTVSVANYHVAGAQKQYGGPIVAKNAKALTIPIAPEAEGKRASEFEGGGRNLFVIPSKSGDPDSRGVLGYSTPDGTFHGLFALRTRTRPQAPDPWFPSPARIGQIGLAEARRILQKAIA